jgi:hypothetical protein
LEKEKLSISDENNTLKFKIGQMYNGIYKPEPKHFKLEFSKPDTKGSYNPFLNYKSQQSENIPTNPFLKPIFRNIGTEQTSSNLNELCKEIGTDLSTLFGNQ